MLAETPCFNRASDLFAMIENQTAGVGGPKWHAQKIVLPDAPLEDLVMWVRNIEDVCDYLIGRPNLAGEITFAPEVIYTSDDETQIVNEMPTGRRWHEILVRTSWFDVMKLIQSNN